MIKKLFIIDGAAGTGKHDLIDFLISNLGKYNCNLINKFSTRAFREKSTDDEKKIDLLFISSEEFRDLTLNRNFYSYEYEGEEYGVDKADIIESIERFENSFLIIRSRYVMERIYDDLEAFATIIQIYIYTDKYEQRIRLVDDGRSSEEIDFRMSRVDVSWNDYLTHNDKNLKIIINNSKISDFHQKITNLLETFSRKNELSHKIYIESNHGLDLIKPIQGYKREIYTKADTTDYEKNIFLMARFRDSNSLLLGYISDIIRQLGYNCVIAKNDDWQLTRNVYNPIAVLYCCKYGIALFDEISATNPGDDKNVYSPNVSYELGFMHMQGKDCLVLKHSSLPDVPFDFVKELISTYSNQLELKPILTSWIGNFGSAAALP
jgi:guanylate kinase